MTIEGEEIIIFAKRDSIEFALCAELKIFKRNKSQGERGHKWAYSQTLPETVHAVADWIGALEFRGFGIADYR